LNLEETPSHETRSHHHLGESFDDLPYMLFPDVGWTLGEKVLQSDSLCF